MKMLCIEECKALCLNKVVKLNYYFISIIIDINIIIKIINNNLININSNLN